MADVYPSRDALLRDYGKLSQEYQNKAGRYIKNLLKLQRAETGVQDKISKLEPPKAPRRSGKLVCNFCGRTEDDVSRMIMGPGVNICNKCISTCQLILSESDVPEDTGDSTKPDEH